MSELILGIEISNPSSGPRGQITLPDGCGPIAAGPGVAIGGMTDDGFAKDIDVELLSEAASHDDDLMPAIDRLCRRHAAAPKDIARIAISIGPGGYTSLRIAVATAKMLAEATGAETIAVLSAAVAAWTAEPASPALVCLASKGNTAWCALLPPDAAHAWWNTSAPAALASQISRQQHEELMQRCAAGKSWIAAMVPLGLLDADALPALMPGLIIADRFLPPHMRDAASAIGARIADPIFSAESVLQIGAGMPATDPMALAPLYPRVPEAVSQWRQKKV